MLYDKHASTSFTESSALQSFTRYVQSFETGTRLDKFLAHNIPHLSRTRLQHLLTSGCVHINGQQAPHSSYRVKENDFLEVNIPSLVDATPQAENIPLQILYEDSDILVLNKAAGMVVHPAPGHPDQTLVNALLAHCGSSLSGIGGVRRPGIVHRLDKDTSGLMVVAKHDQAHHHLSSQFSERTLSRQYLALAWGQVALQTIDHPLGRCLKNRQKIALLSKGKHAVTHVKALEFFPISTELRLGISLIECRLETGRTHQIRVHLQSINHPLIGDPLYGNLPRQAQKYWPPEILRFPRQALHAAELKLIHPHTQEFLKFHAPLPEDMQMILNLLHNL